MTASILTSCYVKAEAHDTLATITQPYLPSSNARSGQQLSADIAETPEDSPPPPMDINHRSRKRKRVASRVPGSAAHHNKSNKRSRGESSPLNERLPHDRPVGHHGVSLLPSESNEQGIIDKEILSQPDTEQLFAMYAYLPPLWS